MLKIKSRIRNLVVKESRKNPHLGLRLLSKIIKEKHNLSISKSSVANILKVKGVSLKLGRKKHFLLYSKKSTNLCGFLLLEAMDSYIGLFDVLKQELAPYFAHLRPAELKKILILLSFSSYFGGTVKKNVLEKGFLKLAGYYAFPCRKIKYVLTRLVAYKPIISLAKIRRNLNVVSTVKFYFNNSLLAFCDARLSTFWAGICSNSYFFDTLKHSEERLANMLKEKVIMINYTMSFNYLSLATINFINGLASGLKKIELLNQDGQLLQKLVPEPSELSFLIGYYPNAVSSGSSFSDRQKKFKNFTFLNQTLFQNVILTKFSQPAGKDDLPFYSIVVKTNPKASPVWAILTDKKTSLAFYLKKYLFLYPCLEKTFLEEMKIIEKFFTSDIPQKNYCEFPDTLSLEAGTDLLKVTELLYSILKNQLGPLDIRHLTGSYSLAKDCLKIALNVSPEFKTNFNTQQLFIGAKPVFLL
jgi:hypothetical protein